MKIRLILVVITLMAMSPPIASPQESRDDLKFGQVYGSAGFLSSKSDGTMPDAPATVLVFISTDGHRSLVLADKAGDYIALLQPGHYCLAAYTRTGKRLQFGERQLTCIDVANSKDVRLDVMLIAAKN